MSFIITGYSVALWVSAAVSLATAAAAWRRRPMPGGVPFVLMMCSVVVWGAMSGMEASVRGVAAKVLFSQLSYIGVCSVAPLFLMFSVLYSTSGKPISPLHTALLWAVPLATIVLAFTNGAHGLVWASFTADPSPEKNILYYAHGPWYWVSVAYSVGVVFSATLAVVRTAIRAPRIYLRQTAILVAGVVLPWVGEALYLSPVNPFPGLDLPPIGFAFTGVLVLLGILRFRLFDVVPMARSVLVERMREGLVVLDPKGRVLDVNPAARQILQVQGRVIGEPAASAFPSLARFLPPPGEAPEEAVSEMPIPGSEVRHCELILSSLRDPLGRVGGYLIVLHDITDRRQVERANLKLIGELTAALADVKTLRGLLPVCASCRKIRNDKGYWQNIENYVTEHTDAQFTHGLCEDCIKKLYPEMEEGPPAPS